ncbi:MAG: 7-cyano-7-deazaguanine synthase [Blastocatellia bacterium]|nr:7-cyano-7-deazaguanine synthase [Blastocatellia bacterium]
MLKASLNLDRAKMHAAATVCVSGGLDSCVLLAKMAEYFPKVYPVFVRNGYSWEDVELDYLKKFISKLDNPAIEPLKEALLPLDESLREYWWKKDFIPGYTEGYSANFIPGRNLLLLNSVLMLTYVNKSPNIALGILAGNPYPDSQIEFFSSFEKTVCLAMEFEIRILTPLLHLEKDEVIRMGKDYPLELSFSCANPQGGLHCGAYCNKCAERQKGFFLSGITDRTEYAFPPPKVDWYNHKWD